jgi:hypothetical protein
MDSVGGSLYNKVNDLMQNVRIEESKGAVHLYVPSFKAEVTNSISPIGEPIQGIKTKDGLVGETKFSASISLTNGNY